MIYDPEVLVDVGQWCSSGRCESHIYLLTDLINYKILSISPWFVLAIYNVYKGTTNTKTNKILYTYMCNILYYNWCLNMCKPCQ